MSESSEVFSAQINVIDAITRPRSSYDHSCLKWKPSTKLKYAPVIQIWATTSAGVCECVVVHRIMPIIYVTCPQREEDQEVFFYDLVKYFEANFSQPIIYSWKIVIKKNIYGYHEAEKFMQLKLLDPDKQQQISDYVTGFVWHGMTVSCFDGKIAPILQFLGRANLAGCGTIRLKNFVRVENGDARKESYPTEIHCVFKDIVCDRADTKSQILSHLGVVWNDQRRIRRRLGVDSQAVVTCTTRSDLIFTQRRPAVKGESLSAGTSQELEELLGFLEKYDPDVSIEAAKKEILKTQKEVESVMEEGPLYQTPSRFDPGRPIDTLKPLDVQETRPCIQSWATRLVRNEVVSVYEEPSQQEQNDEKKGEKSNSVSSGEHSQVAADLLSVMVIEVGSKSRRALKPDPKFDELMAITWAVVVNQVIRESGILCVKKVPFQCGYSTVFVESERDLLNAFTNLVLTKNPDVIGAYNNEKEGFSYINERAAVLGIPDWFDEIARTKKRIVTWDGCRRVSGRVMLTLWRLVNHKVDYRNYSLTTVSQHVLGHPFPELKHQQLMIWAVSTPHRFVTYYMKRLLTVIQIVNKMAMIDDFSEKAAIVGCDFCSAISRGSQFLIESLLSRVAWRNGYILYAPTRRQVLDQRAPMCFALVMEPSSGFYSDPVMVLDFQSLYPSAIIAYNLCYSTTFGRDEIIGAGEGKLGASYYYVPNERFRQFVEEGNVVNTPNDVYFLKPNVRRGIMPILLDELLSLRSFIKQTLKTVDDENMKRSLEARQAALKLLLACAYGYTGANYSGRMPMMDLGDAIVECSRHMIEFVLTHIKQEYPEFEVLYGDTDSLFIRMPPASKEECFDIADKMCEHITSFFPSPVRIKLEKIFFGCFLVNKKRYCGWAYESLKQTNPVLDVKGLEMKRRDSCPLVAKTMTSIVETILETHSIDSAKAVFADCIDQILSGNVPLSDYVFAREVRLGSYRGLEPPGALVARKRMEADPMDAPLFGERIPYVVVAGVPGSRLYERVVSPEQVLRKKLRIGTRYYIERQIVPALGRILEVMNVNINEWMAGRTLDLLSLQPFVEWRGNTMDRFCLRTKCPLCFRSGGQRPVCSVCLTYAGREESLLELIQRTKRSSRRVQEYESMCRNCIGIIGASDSCCLCRGCDVYWQLALWREKEETLRTYIGALKAELGA